MLEVGSTERTPIPWFDRKKHETGRWGDSKIKKQQKVRSLCINREIKSLIFIEAFVM